MANCCICKKKVSMFEAVPLSTKVKKDACGDCMRRLRALRTYNTTGSNESDAQEAVWYFRGIMPSISLDDDVKAEIEELMTPLEEKEKKQKETKEKQERRINEAESIMQTTGYNFEGFRITKYLKVLSGETVIGTGFLSELDASLSDLLGANASSFEGKLDRAKDTALRVLLLKAKDLGANAIIGIDFDYITFQNNMIGVVANGTAVVVEKEEAED